MQFIRHSAAPLKPVGWHISINRIELYIEQENEAQREFEK